MVNRLSTLLLRNLFDTSSFSPKGSSNTWQRKGIYLKLAPCLVPCSPKISFRFNSLAYKFFPSLNQHTAAKYFSSSSKLWLIENIYFFLKWNWPTFKSNCIEFDFDFPDQSLLPPAVHCWSKKSSGPSSGPVERPPFEKFWSDRLFAVNTESSSVQGDIFQHLLRLHASESWLNFLYLVHIFHLLDTK